MFNNLFNYDNGVFQFLSRLVDLAFLNLLFMICCIPIFTIGASTTAMYTVTLRMVKNEEGSIAGNFFSAFKANFKKSTIMWLIIAAVLGVLFVDYRFWLVQSSSVSKIMGIVTLSLLLILALGIVWLFPLQAKFENSVKNTFKNSFLFAVKYLPTSIVLLAVNGAYLAFNYVLVIGIMVTLVIGFAAVAYICSIFIRKVFNKYIPEDEYPTY